jgi:ribose transport system permease protein
VSAAAAPVEVRRTRFLDQVEPIARRNAWSLGLLAFLGVLLLFTKFIQPTYGVAGVQGLGISVLPLALAAAAQAVVVISGGIDLSIGALMALTNVVAAVLMKDQSDQFAVLAVVGTLALGAVLGGINGGLVVVTRVPDIVVTLAMSFVWAGCALIVLPTPGGGSASWLLELVTGSLGNEWIPKAAVVLIVVVAVIWIPVRRSRQGLSLYAIGSNQLAAFRSGVSVGRTKILAYGLMGLFAALAGLSLTASTGIGTPVPGPYTLLSVAAVVLGGVSLAGGRGGLFGPIVAVVILQLIRTDMTFLDIDTNLATVVQGLILIGVVMIGSLIQLRRARA